MFSLNILLGCIALAKEVSVDFFLVQDLSHSYKVDLPYLQTQIPDIVTYLATEYDDSRFGMASFVDKPMGTFGYLESEDFCYELNVPLMKVGNEQKEVDGKSVVRGVLTRENGEKFDLKEVLDNLDTYSGRDRKENQLGALLHTLVSEKADWDNEKRIPLIVLATDDKYHTYGDGKAAGLVRTENAYAKPPSEWCLSEDYPTIHDIKIAVDKIGAKLIFVVTEKMVPEYTKLLQAIGPDKGVVVQLKNRSEFIAQVIKHGIAHMDLDGDSFGEAAADQLEKLVKVEKDNMEDPELDKVVAAKQGEGEKPQGKGAKGFSVLPTMFNSTPLLACPPNIVFDIMLVQDASASFEDDLPELQKRVPKVFKEILETYPGSRVGLSAFVDKPVEPFGYKESGDYCSIVFSGLSDNVSGVQDKLNTLQIRSGDDPLEAQLHALVHLAHSKKAEWNFDLRDDKDRRVIRVAALVTDAGYHKAGDTDLPKHSGKSLDCETHDYPSVEQAAMALKKKRIFPVFLVTPEMEAVYEDLLQKMEIHGVVSINNEVSSNINKSILSGLEAICSMEYMADPDEVSKAKEAKEAKNVPKKQKKAKKMKDVLEDDDDEE